MKVAGNNRIGNQAIRKASPKGAASGGFSVASTAPAPTTESAATVSTASPVASVDALLAIQEVPNERESKRQAVRRGGDMLDILDEIRMGILMGSVPQNRLEQLVRLVEKRRDEFLDPNLSAVLDEIELRARVELAKLDKVPR